MFQLNFRQTYKYVDNSVGKIREALIEEIDRSQLKEESAWNSKHILEVAFTTI